MGHRSFHIDTDEAPETSGDIPPPVHSADEVHSWFRDVVLPSLEVWVADEGGAVIGLLVIEDA